MSHATGSSSEEFFRSVLDSMAENVAVIDLRGDIHYVNRPWLRFCADNEGPTRADWTRYNYLAVCDDAAADGDKFGRLAREGIEAIAEGQSTDYSLEYPCHSPDESRWFLAQMTPLEVGGAHYIVVCHHDITQRKLAEEKAEALARTDALTGVANRKHLDEVLDREWRRASRSGAPISVLLLDIDFFKPYNDHFGHQAGDECLRRVGDALQALFPRAHDIVARYGGEEFIVVLAGTGTEDACRNAERVLEAIRDLAIVHGHSSAGDVITVSIGVATAAPTRQDDPSDLIQAADEALYAAKRGGRDRYCVGAVSA